MEIQRKLEMNLPDNQSCFLWGARKTGKSTFLKMNFLNSKYIDLLKADVFQLYSRKPERLREELEANDTISTVIVDEIQKVPLLLDEIHYLIEQKKSVKFIMCGSSARKIKLTGANLLGGRAWRYMFAPLCYAETQELNWNKIFNNGMIPSHYLDSSFADKLLASYLYDYVLPEVQLEANIRKRDAFSRFIDILGFSNGQMINYNNIARDVGVDAKTVKTYFEILEDMYLGYYLYPYRERSKRSVITEVPKFYLFDTGLANYIRRYKFTEMTGFEAGTSFEHYIFLELIAYKLLNEKRDSINYWRDKQGNEVDFLFQDNAFEVKITSDINNKHIKGLLKFSSENNFKLNVICMEKNKRVITENGKQITIWPVQDFLESLWNDDIWK